MSCTASTTPKQRCKGVRRGTDLEAAAAAGEEERGQVRVAVDGRDVGAGEHEGLDDVQHAPHHAAVALARAYPPREKIQYREGGREE